MSLQFAAFSAQFLIFAGLAYLTLIGLFYAFAPAAWVMRARGIQPAAPIFVHVPAPAPAPTAYRDAKGRWRDAHTNRFCKAPAFA